MRPGTGTSEGSVMTTDELIQTPALGAEPPLSGAVQRTVSGSLGVGAALSGGFQYAEYLRAGDLEREDQIAWGLAHHSFYQLEWAAGMVGSFLLLLGFLGLWHVTRWSTPKLTAVGAVILTWGMSGQLFSEVGTYTAQVVAAKALGPGPAETLIAEGYLKDGGMIAVVLVPVIAGMLFGVIVLAVACWRSGLGRVPSVLLALWPLWDFFGPGPVGPLSADLFLIAAGVWLAAAVVRLPREHWLGRSD